MGVEHKTIFPEKEKNCEGNAYLDVEVFGVVEDGLERFGLEGHIDFDFLDLAMFGGF